MAITPAAALPGLVDSILIRMLHKFSAATIYRHVAIFRNSDDSPPTPTYGVKRDIVIEKDGGIVS